MPIRIVNRSLTWSFREEEEEVASGLYQKSVEVVEQGMHNAEAAKERGNKAFVRKDRAQAVAQYTEAIESLTDAWVQRPTDAAEERKIKSMFAVCYSNRAASYLLAGEGQDGEKALDDADNAIKYDPDYAKGCVLLLVILEEKSHAGSVTGITAKQRLCRSYHGRPTRLTL